MDSIQDKLTKARAEINSSYNRKARGILYESQHELPDGGLFMTSIISNPYGGVTLCRSITTPRTLCNASQSPNA